MCESATKGNIIYLMRRMCDSKTLARFFGSIVGSTDGRMNANVNMHEMNEFQCRSGRAKRQLFMSMDKHT